MLKKKIIASSINNLTDARYFAGWMVDYFVFNIDPKNEYYINPQEIGVFQSWVAGPAFYLEMSKEQINFSEKYLVDLNCQGIIIDFSDRSLLANVDIPFMVKMKFQEYSENLAILDEMKVDVIITTDEKIDIVLQSLKDLEKQNHKIYLDFRHEELSGNQLINNSLEGFLVHGSPEEKVGFKSYDELDDIFEILQDF